MNTARISRLAHRVHVAAVKLDNSYDAFYKVQATDDQKGKLKARVINDHAALREAINELDADLVNTSIHQL